MDKKLLTIQALEKGKMYDMVDNPHPNYLLYFVDEEGALHHYDTVMKCDGKSSITYNKMLKTRFYEAPIRDYGKEASTYGSEKFRLLFGQVG